MTAILLLLALVSLAAIGRGVGRLRATRRGPLGGAGVPERLRAWFATLHGRRGMGFGIAAGAALVFLLLPVLRP